MKIAWDRDEMIMRSSWRMQENHIKRTGHLHEKDLHEESISFK